MRGEAHNTQCDMLTKLAGGESMALKLDKCHNLVNFTQGDGTKREA